MSGQQQSQNEPTAGQISKEDEINIKVNVDLLTTDVTVVGKRTGELRREDFVVFDKGVSQEITYFSRNELPLAVAIVLDTSSSVALWMPMQQLAALTALRRLKPGDQAALFTFADTDRLICKLTDEKLLVAKEIGRVRSGEHTNLLDALFDAAQYLRENAPRRRRAIILISDGYYDTGSRYSPEKCLAALLEADVTLYEIGIPGSYIGGIDKAFAAPVEMVEQIRGKRPFDRRDEKLKLMEKETGGDHFSIIELRDLSKIGKQAEAEGFFKIKLTGTKAAFEQAIPRLREQYTVGFNPSDSGNIGRSHSLIVRFSDNNRCPGCKAITRSSYYAAKTAAQLALQNIPKEKIQPAANEDEEMQRNIISAAAGAQRCNDIQFEASASMQPGATGAQEMKIDVKIVADTIQFETKENQRIGKLRITFFYVDRNRKIFGSDWKTVEIRRNAEEKENAAKSDILYSTPIPFNPSCKLIKVVVLDMANDQIGSKEIDVIKRKK